VRFALDFRMEFKRDVFIDLLGYRKYGHNEGDEPRFTQPKLYKAIAKHKNPRDIYAESLISQGLIDSQYIKTLEKNYKASLETELEDSRKEDKTVITPFMQDAWTNFKRARADRMLKIVDTSYPQEKLSQIAKVISTLPESKKFIRKIERLVQSRQTMFDTDKLDWAMAEHLAYGSLLEEGYDVRISGQDVERGTFSHRHAVVKAEDSEEELLLLNNISSYQGKFQIYNSLLSEYGVVGFDYGYAMASPNTLTIWEAQFGDFSNGAQIMIDQYISCGENKWKTPNGIVMLLPHGYEGQGAEHSSGRMERYLQLCAKNNMFVVDCSTPANMFHLLRRQLKSNYRKPLIVFTPKSLLRHPRVISTVEDFSNGSFQPLIDDLSAKASNIKTVVFVTGKFFYDLLEAKESLNRTDVALVRIEQLFPLPESDIASVLSKYKQTSDIVWAQEEPRNMGAYAHMLLHVEAAKNWRVASRRSYSAPAAGSATRSKRRHQEIIDFVFDKTKDNQRKKSKSKSV
jgi:2-oxoglutarate dehydrogenase E1 component